MNWVLEGWRGFPWASFIQTSSDSLAAALQIFSYGVKCYSESEKYSEERKHKTKNVLLEDGTYLSLVNA